MTQKSERTPSTPPASTPNRGPFEGLTVLDFTTHKAGPLATYLLAGLGASVIKIEEAKGDAVRGYAPFVNPDGSLSMWKEHPEAISLSILNRARGKQSITLNLKSPEAKEIYRDLASRADIVVENYASGTAERLGIGYEATRAINPRIIYCSINGFGAGAMPGRKALDVVIQAMSGIMMASGSEGDPPGRLGLSIADAIAPLFGVMGINAALYRRERTGEGEYIEVSMLGALTGLLAVENWQATERLGAPNRTGNFNVKSTPLGVYRCSDGDIAIAAGNRDHFTHALFRVMGRPEMIEDPRFATLPARAKRDAELTQLVDNWCSGLTMDEVERRLMEVGIPVAKVRTPAEAVEDPLVNDRGEVVPSLHPELGELPGLKTMGVPMRLHNTSYGHGAASPHLGEHNESIYCDWLGIDRKRFDELRSAGVI
jgi:crotonobetainyl-CoA:carnitine CoA-transferase CaiB-like acyl-CoA transferase